MAELIPEIRNAARALIVRQDKILLLRKEADGGCERFALPGGGQDPGESLKQALNRECLEEIGTVVEIGDLLHVADFFKLRDTQPPTRRHLVEFLFRCNIADDYTPRNGHHPDKHQVAVVWAELEQLSQLRLDPPYLSAWLAQPADRGKDLYLGSFHDHATA